MIKYVIFDFDGTLADSGGIAVMAMNKMARKYGFTEIEWEKLDDLRKMSVQERCRYMKVPLIRIPFLANEYYSIYKEAMPGMDLYEGMRELLETLHARGYGIAIISSNAESNIRSFLQQKGIGIIDKILCSHHIFDKDIIINRFLRQNKLRNGEVVYVGDEVRDISACKKAGVRIIWVDWGLDLLSTVKSAEPDHMASQPADILRIIEELEKNE
ncbi:MAG: HAD-IA family hydrolase [Clostridia bacterium]|nr:HAD-IA family hydrolase [Clostridia bacterium]